MRLLNELKPNEIDLKKEIEVAITLQDLAVIYAVLAEESTSSVQGKLERKGLDVVAKALDDFTNDVTYDLYIIAGNVLENEGLAPKEVF